LKRQQAQRHKAERRRGRSAENAFDHASSMGCARRGAILFHHSTISNKIYGERSF
jgi:hypothetical protein